MIEKIVLVDFICSKKESIMAPDELLVHYMLKTIYPNTPTTITNTATNPKVTLSCFSLLIILICIF
jgi:hypothetical protein